jgi:hypothetical protein
MQHRKIIFFSSKKGDKKKALCDPQGFNPPMADKYQEQLSVAAKMPDFGIQV